jgi:DNA primase
MLTDTHKIEVLRNIFDREGVLDGRSENLSLKCPNPECGSHAKSKKKFIVRVSDLACHCWVCDIRGRGVGWITRKFKPELHSSLPEEMQARSSGREIIDEEPEEELKLPPGTRLMHSSWQANERDPDFRACSEYLLERGIPHDWWLRFRLCWTRRGRYRRSVIVPSFDSTGKLNYIVGRRVDPHVKWKYTNEGGKSSEIVFNELDVDWDSPIFLVEGPFDWLVTNQKLNSVCALGSNIGNHSALFRRLIIAGMPVMICMDPDVSDKASRFAARLYSYGVEARLVRLPNGEDPGTLGPDRLADLASRTPAFRPENELVRKIRSIGSGSIFV